MAIAEEPSIYNIPTRMFGRLARAHEDRETHYERRRRERRKRREERRRELSHQVLGVLCGVPSWAKLSSDDLVQQACI